ncbi:unnamed protein product [Leptidea sinapis]|uniref:Uncharacterized protein n=1 Tax=Leptidea sinapis TaxID=189913 RepID=A0A5E4QSD7_9NEOP|nr:unnamed protein product [Leptidea sinapis]
MSDIRQEFVNFNVQMERLLTSVDGLTKRVECIENKASVSVLENKYTSNNWIAVESTRTVHSASEEVVQQPSSLSIGRKSKPVKGGGAVQPGQREEQPLAENQCNLGGESSSLGWSSSHGRTSSATWASELPSFEQFKGFIENRFRALECVEPKRTLGYQANIIAAHKPRALIASSPNVSCIPDVPKSVEILQHIQVNSIEPYPIITNSDLITSCQYSYQGTSGAQVDWNNFLDKDLFLDLDIETNESTHINHHKNQFQNGDQSSKENENRKGKSTISKTIKKKGSSKNAQINSELTSTIKNSYRKKKYTTTVKNWLNDNNHGIKDDPIIEIPVIVHENNENIDVIVENTSKGTGKIGDAFFEIEKGKKIKLQNENVEKPKEKRSRKADITGGKIKEKTSKKVVQSTLANKDGIMKYCKPKKLKTNAEDVNLDTEIQLDNVSLGSNGASDNQTANFLQHLLGNDKIIKEKKIKSRFVAPINSQIPVRDVVYEVVHITEDIAAAVQRQVESAESVVICLTYSNGFCQLSGQYTEAACVADALMLLVSDVFYYCRGNTKYTADFVSFVLKERTIYCYDAKIILIYLMSQLNIEPCALDMKIFDVKVSSQE